MSVTIKMTERGVGQQLEGGAAEVKGAAGKTKLHKAPLEEHGDVNQLASGTNEAGSQKEVFTPEVIDSGLRASESVIEEITEKLYELTSEGVGDDVSSDIVDTSTTSTKSISSDEVNTTMAVVSWAQVISQIAQHLLESLKSRHDYQLAGLHLKQAAIDFSVSMGNLSLDAARVAKQETIESGHDQMIGAIAQACGTAVQGLGQVCQGMGMVTKSAMKFNEKADGFNQKLTKIEENINNAKILPGEDAGSYTRLPPNGVAASADTKSKPGVGVSEYVKEMQPHVEAQERDYAAKFRTGNMSEEVDNFVVDRGKVVDELETNFGKNDLVLTQSEQQELLSLCSAIKNQHQPGGWFNSNTPLSRAVQDMSQMRSYRYTVAQGVLTSVSALGGAIQGVYSLKSAEHQGESQWEQSVSGMYQNLMRLSDVLNSIEGEVGQGVTKAESSVLDAIQNLRRAAAQATGG